MHSAQTTQCTVHTTAMLCLCLSSVCHTPVFCQSS